MQQTTVDALNAYHWEPQPQAEKLVRGMVDEFLAKCPDAARLATRMRDQTGTRFIDWVEWIGVRPTRHIEEELLRAGFARHTSEEGREYFSQPRGVFPRVSFKGGAAIEVAIKVDSVADFAAANAIDHPIQGEPGNIGRRLRAYDVWDARLWAVERHGYTGFAAPDFDAELALARHHHLERFRTRRRYFDRDEEGFAHLEATLDEAIDDLGRDVACDAFFAAEREYWQRRNRAAQVQKARQDRLGLGWANHDHHTYRCSRRHFARLIGIWEKLGFELRERFYAGAEAGWGAQVAEHPVCGIITFNDVDLSPDELLNDFAHDPLPDRNELGTVGLWCALHGESILQAGMHHLECQFDFDFLKRLMEQEANIKVMKPFTDFPYLRQAFTEGERWPVAEERIAALLSRNQITPEQAQKFRSEGAIGSHLENLERNQGFKGFNQQGVNQIIARTDPRKS